MSLTKVSYSMIQGTPINVIDYGAVGDGSTDDTAAIQAAIDAAPTNGVITGSLGSIYAINNRINVDGKRLTDIQLVYKSNNAKLVLISNAQFTNSIISVGTTIPTVNSSLCGVINLHLSTGGFDFGVCGGSAISFIWGTDLYC